MILAAGRGERLRPLTDTLPKPLVEVGGRSLIAWHLERLARAGINDVVVNLSWLGGLIRAAVGDGSAFGLRVRYSDEGDSALETGGGIRRALPLLGPGPFLVVNGDIFCDHSLRLPAPAEHCLAHLVMVANPAHHPDGDFGLRAGTVVAAAPRYTFSGIGVYRPELFAGEHPEAFPLAPLLKDAIGRNAVSGELWAGCWSDVGSPTRYQALLDALADRQASARLPHGRRT